MDDIELEDIVDPHAHWRGFGGRAESVVPFSSFYCAYALGMPNNPALRTGEQTMDYNDGVSHIALRAGHDCTFIPCMLITDETTPDMIVDASARGVKVGKAYASSKDGKSVSTAEEGSKRPEGVSDFKAKADVWDTMQQLRMRLALHGEVPSAFVLDREKAFLPTLVWLAETFLDLKISDEHITTAAAVVAIGLLRDGVVGTITAHHIFDHLGFILGDKLNPHGYCKPVHKRPEDLAALIKAAVSLNPKFFFGSDTAPRPVEDKECAHGCAGAFTAPHAIEMVATVFSGATQMSEEELRPQLQHFLSDAAREHYELPPKGKRMRLVQKAQTVPASYEFGSSTVIPYRAGETLPYTLVAA
jgi:dihydroorotase